MVIYPVGSGPLPIRKLAGFHLADKNCTGIDKALDGDRVCGLRRVEAIHGPVAIARLNARYVVDVLDSEPDACERFRSRSGVVQARGYSDGRRFDTR